MLAPFALVTTTCVWQMSFVAFSPVPKVEPSSAQAVVPFWKAGTVAWISQSLSTGERSSRR